MAADATSHLCKFGRIDAQSFLERAGALGSRPAIWRVGPGLAITHCRIVTGDPIDHRLLRRYLFRRRHLPAQRYAVLGVRSGFPRLGSYGGFLSVGLLDTPV